ADLVGDPAGGGGVGGGEDEVVDGAAELRPHRPLAGGGGQDEPHRLLELPVTGGQGDGAGGVGVDGKGPSRPDELLAHDVSLVASVDLHQPALEDEHGTALHRRFGVGRDVDPEPLDLGPGLGLGIDVHALDVDVAGAAVD